VQARAGQPRAGAGSKSGGLRRWTQCRQTSLTSAARSGCLHTAPRDLGKKETGITTQII